LFGGCRAWKRECLALKKRVEKITGKRRKPGSKSLDLFKDERLTGALSCSSACIVYRKTGQKYAQRRSIFL
jgi:hypothetical protein